ncbi:MAG: hypothetical protein O2820_14190 [Planctomycetota bacterium]|nr:hypothetical protein [Planctomycetota bacterium]MDA1250363.1 hypothetical protein [Planctomycetota bacterium]
MNFPYQSAIVAAPETGVERVIYRPVIPLLVCGPEDGLLVAGLVDTGADNTLFPIALAEALDIELTRCAGPSPVAFGGGTLETYFGTVMLQISDGNDDCEWEGRVLFHAGRDESIILGGQGFLEYFAVEFDGPARAMRLENDSMPDFKNDSH